MGTRNGFVVKLVPKTEYLPYFDGTKSLEDLDKNNTRDTISLILRAPKGCATLSKLVYGSCKNTDGIVSSEGTHKEVDYGLFLAGLNVIAADFIFFYIADGAEFGDGNLGLAFKKKTKLKLVKPWLEIDTNKPSVVVRPHHTDTHDFFVCLDEDVWVLNEANVFGTVGGITLSLIDPFTKENDKVALVDWQFSVDIIDNQIVVF